MASSLLTATVNSDQNDEKFTPDNKTFVESNLAQLRSHFGTCYAEIATLRVIENVADCPLSIKFDSFGLLITLQITSDYSLSKAKLIINISNKSEQKYSKSDLVELENQLESVLIRSDDLKSSNTVLIELFTRAVEFALDKNPKANVKRTKVHGKATKSDKKSGSNSDEDLNSKKVSMKTAADVVNRIQWDDKIDQNFITVGYMDRFVGLKECAFTTFDWGDIVLADLGALAIPEHRIVYFKFKNHLIWDKRSRMDNVFGSTGSNITIHEVIARHQDEIYESKIEPEEEVHKVGKVVHKYKSELIDESDHEKPRNLEPNYFISLPIQDKTVKANFNKLASELVESNPAIEPHLVPMTSLHLTLCTLRINDRDELDMVKHILQTIVELEPELFKQAITFNFNGMGDFYDKVRFVKCKSEQMDVVKRWRGVLLEKLRDSGIDLAGNYFEFVPHLTIMKISNSSHRAQVSSYNLTATALFDMELWQKYKEFSFGTETINEIELCKMTNIFVNKSYPVDVSVRLS